MSRTMLDMAEFTELVSWLKSGLRYETGVCCSRSTAEHDRLVAVGRREVFGEVLAKLIGEEAADE